MTPACRQGPAGCVSDRGNPRVYLEVTKSLGRPKLTANEAIGQSAQWMVEDQKRWVQKAFLRPGHRFGAGPRPPLSASSDGTSGETPTPLPGPPPRRGHAHGPVRPLAVGVKPGARELGRWKSFRVRPFSAEVALRESCRRFGARSRPLFQRSFPGPSPLAASVPRPS